jgi:hypothetical protein
MGTHYHEIFNIYYFLKSQQLILHNVKPIVWGFTKIQDFLNSYLKVPYFQ